MWMRMQEIFFGQGMWMRTLLHRVNFFNQVSRDAGIRIFGPARLTSDFRARAFQFLAQFLVLIVFNKRHKNT
jgi:hypothetical protein